MCKKFDVKNLVLDKLTKMDLYEIQCSDCGWKNSKEINAHFCPKCGKNLWVGRVNKVNGSIFSIPLNAISINQHSEENEYKKIKRETVDDCE